MKGNKMGRKKKEIRLKEPVRIQEKKIAGGNISLYLDIQREGLVDWVKDPLFARGGQGSRKML